MKYTVLTVATTLISIIIYVMPFHAFLTVWGSSLFGHYIALRLWKEVLLLILAVGACFLLLIDHKIRTHTLPRRLVWTILTYCFLLTAWGIIAYSRDQVTTKAFGYGLITDLRFPVFFLLTWTIALRTNRLHKRSERLIMGPAVLVIIFGLLQVFALPRDFLRHFGYSEATIYPYETINHNINYIRVASTLRGANPLGTYLIIPISLLTVFLAAGRRNWQRFALLAGALTVLFFSYSRAAWVGTALSIAVVLAVGLRSTLLRKEFLVGGVVLLVAFAGLAITAHGNARLENVFLHTESHSQIKKTSNEGHLSATMAGLKDVAHHPLGQGVGSSGPASVYNKQQRIPENYYLQIGEEAGWLGLGIFVFMNVGIGYLLWLRRHDPLALCLFASLIGISAVNLFSQAWGDDTLAYVWWGLAGVAMVNAPTAATKTKKK
ncbi:MAG: hypothetical protein JWO41_190 [Candidatus Saccharibacteria bacterium]|nr:hypothetical protein [Candidatus Saccharibacteria bacterium]